MNTETLLSLHDRLREDHVRAGRAFSEDMQLAAQLILKPYAYDHEVAEVLRRWCMKHQPCQFGRVAASRGQVYFCVLRERDLADGDARIQAKIATAKRHWKQRAVTDTQTPPHSFVLVFATDRLMLAAPDENLRRFSDRLLELAGWAPPRRAKRGENPISSDFLYLQNPSNDAYYGFQFNIDFFAAAGDGRWWRDHRLPAGIGFTANSTGHIPEPSLEALAELRIALRWFELPADCGGQRHRELEAGLFRGRRDIHEYAISDGLLAGVFMNEIGVIKDAW